MIKVGFICEGYTEQKLLNSSNFKLYLHQLGIDMIEDIINAEGAGNLLPHNILGYIDRLKSKSANKIIILTDLDDDICITNTKKRINASANEIVVIAVKKIESLFLACNSAMQKYLQDDAFYFEFPEKELVPFEKIRQLKLEKTGRGFNKNTGGKINLINNLLALGLDITEAAKHPNCPSAKYFINQLEGLAK